MRSWAPRARAQSAEKRILLSFENSNYAAFSCAHSDKNKKRVPRFYGRAAYLFPRLQKTSNNTQPAGTVIIWANFHNVMSSLILSGRNY